MTLHSNFLSRSTPSDEALSTAILDHLGVPILLVNCDATVSYANAAAHALINGDGLIKAVNSILSTSHAGDGERLRSAVADTCANGAGRVVVLGGESDVQPLVALVLPFHAEGRHPRNGRALVMLRSGQGLSELLVNSLRQLFRLSPAEASIAVALGTGIDLVELAHQRKVKLNTLRSQVASIMAKTGTRRQAQLVALVARIDCVL
jgi:DNA-binding CsgD family transcriptional regulator